jgi:hypothetical protein
MHPAAMESAGYWYRECSVPAAPLPAPQPPPPNEPPAEDTAAEADRYAVIYPGGAE